MNRPTARGFTLIELLTTVAIVGILAAIAYPAYTKYLVKSNRSAAETYLMDLAQSESQFMADSRSYVGLDQLPAAPQAVSDNYTIAVDPEVGPPATFTITATPKNAQAAAGEQQLSIDNTGARAPASLW